MWIEMVPLRQLATWPGNPKAHDEVVLGESFERFGFIDPVIVDEATGRIVAGHGRREKLLQLQAAGATPPGRVEVAAGGDWLVPVLRGVRFQSEKEAEAYLLTNNQSVFKGGWNDSALDEMLLRHTDNLAGLGWTADEVSALCSAVKVAEVPEVDLEGIRELPEDEVPEPPRVAVTRVGDVWTLGRHRLVCGDCRDPRTLGKAQLADKVTLAITSPPYAAQRRYDEQSGFVPVPPEEYVQWFERVQRAVASVLADDGSWLLNIKEHVEEGQRHLYVHDLVIAHVRRWGWRYVDEFCWQKPGFPGDFKGRFKNGWEPVFHFARGAEHKHRPMQVAHASADVRVYAPGNQMTMGAEGYQVSEPPERVEGFARPSNVIATGTARTPREMKHSAAFPVALVSFFVQGFTDAGDIVFDPFMGYGTTLVTAEQLDRPCVGVELSPAYCDVIVERWQSLTGRTATRARAGKASGRRAAVEA